MPRCIPSAATEARSEERTDVGSDLRMRPAAAGNLPSDRVRVW